jgi:hypothetical protein
MRLRVTQDLEGAQGEPLGVEEAGEPPRLAVIDRRADRLLWRAAQSSGPDPAAVHASVGSTQLRSVFRGSMLYYTLVILGS